MSDKPISAKVVLEITEKRFRTPSTEAWLRACEKIMQHAYDRLVKSGKLPKSPL